MKSVYLFQLSTLPTIPPLAVVFTEYPTAREIAVAMMSGYHNKDIDSYIMAVSIIEHMYQQETLSKLIVDMAFDKDKNNALVVAMSGYGHLYSVHKLEVK